MKQRDAVYNAVVNVLTNAGVAFEDGMDASSFLTKELRSQVQEQVAQGFANGTIDFDDSPSNQAKLRDDSKLLAYVSGLISNWLRKDRRLNGNVTYSPKNPGSRAGQGDEQLRTLRALHRQFVGVDDEKADTIKQHIDARIEEIRAANALNTKVDVSTLSPELIASLGLNS